LPIYFQKVVLRFEEGLLSIRHRRRRARCRIMEGG
jgi:hypothetical protein